MNAWRGHHPVRARILPALWAGSRKAGLRQIGRTGHASGTDESRGREIDSGVADDPEISLIRDQVEMGVAVCMAVLEALAANLPNAAGDQR